MTDFRGESWVVNKIGTYPQLYVEPYNLSNIKISFFPSKDTTGVGIVLPRNKAKILAKRITQCLDETKILRKKIKKLKTKELK